MKNLIDIARERGYDKSLYERMMIPHWDDFFSEAKMKESYIVGVGAGLQYLLDNYATSIRIDYLVDNSDIYSNGTAGEYLPYAFETCVDKFPIRSYDTLLYYPEFVVNTTDYMDGEELVAASDIVIADYSSIMFEPAFRKEPVFLFSPDKEE